MPPELPRQAGQCAPTDPACFGGLSACIVTRTTEDHRPSCAGATGGGWQGGDRNAEVACFVLSLQSKSLCARVRKKWDRMSLSHPVLPLGDFAAPRPPRSPPGGALPGGGGAHSSPQARGVTGAWALGRDLPCLPEGALIRLFSLFQG